MADLFLCTTWNKLGLAFTTDGSTPLLSLSLSILQLSIWFTYQAFVSETSVQVGEMTTADLNYQLPSISACNTCYMACQ